MSQREVKKKTELSAEDFKYGIEKIVQCSDSEPSNQDYEESLNKQARKAAKPQKEVMEAAQAIVDMDVDKVLLKDHDEEFNKLNN
jgi:hypothetical protein